MREGGRGEESELDWDRRGLGDGDEGGRRRRDGRERGERKVTGKAAEEQGEGRRGGGENGSVSGGKKTKRSHIVTNCFPTILLSILSKPDRLVFFSPLFVALLLRNGALKSTGPFVMSQGGAVPVERQQAGVCLPLSFPSNPAGAKAKPRGLKQRARPESRL